MSDEYGLDDAELRRRLDALSDEGSTAGPDTVLAGAQASVSRSTRNQRLAIGAGAAAALVVLVVVSIAVLTGDDSNEGVAVTTPPEPTVAENAITFTLELDATEVVAGETLGARLVIQNTTGEPLELADENGCGAIWAVNILPVGSEETDPYGVRENDDACRAPNQIHVRDMPVRLELLTKQPTCEPPFPTSEYPGDPRLCLAMIPSDLEPGTYEVRVLLNPQVVADSTGRYPVILPEPIQVEVLPADPVVQAGLDRIMQALDSLGIGPARIENGVVVVEPERGGIFRIWPEAAGDPLPSQTDMAIGGVHVLILSGAGHGWDDLYFDCADGTRFRLFGNGLAVTRTIEAELAELIPALGCEPA